MWFFALTALMFSLSRTAMDECISTTSTYWRWHLIEIPNKRTHRHTEQCSSIDHQSAASSMKIGLARVLLLESSTSKYRERNTWRWLTIRGNYGAVVVVMKVMMRQKDGFNLQIEWPAMRNPYLLPLSVRSCSSHHSPPTNIVTLPPWSTCNVSTWEQCLCVCEESVLAHRMTISKESGR